MVRHYLPDPVPRETVERIVATVRRAPSGGFSQGHRLVVVTDPEVRGELARLAGEEEYVAAGHDPWVSVAPVHVFVGTREESYHERYRQPDKLRGGEEIGWPAPYWYVDAGAAFMLLQLAALDEGLATGVYGVLPESVPQVKALLGVPDDVHFVCVVTIGYQVPDPRESALVSRLSKRRLPLDELVRWEHWEAVSAVPEPWPEEAVRPAFDDRRSRVSRAIPPTEVNSMRPQAVIEDVVHGRTVHGAMLSVCPVPGCTALTMGGTCVEHDPPVKIVFPRGRPFSLEDAEAAEPVGVGPAARLPA
jgi:FMN reductase [NAD(P)H]